MVLVSDSTLEWQSAPCNCIPIDQLTVVEPNFLKYHHNARMYEQNKCTCYAKCTSIQ